MKLIEPSILVKLPEYDNHEEVLFFYENNINLKGFISIHNSSLGSATGGTRMYFYQTEVEALRDVLNLSKAMTYKCAMADVPFGGGKAVIINNPTYKSNNLLQTYGEIINSLKGKFTTGTDVGITDDDTIIMARKSKYILGQREKNKDMLSTSKMAALGVFYSIKTAVQERFQTNNLKGIRIAIKGLGKLGGELVRLLKSEGVDLILSDIDPDKMFYYQGIFPDVKLVNSEQISKQKVEVYSPNAMGREFTDENLDDIQAAIIAGGANNQLDNNKIGLFLHQKGILYAPDYIVNAGGLINIVDELNVGGYNKNRVLSKIKNISITLNKVFSLAQRMSISTIQAADMLVKEKIKKL